MRYSFSRGSDQIRPEEVVALAAVRIGTVTPDATQTMAKVSVAPGSPSCE